MCHTYTCSFSKYSILKEQLYTEHISQGQYSLFSKENYRRHRPFEAEYVYAYILELYREIISPGTADFDNLNEAVNCRLKCGFAPSLHVAAAAERIPQDKVISVRIAREHTYRHIEQEVIAISKSKKNVLICIIKCD
jgi:hypothetical protein